MNVLSAGFIQHPEKKSSKKTTKKVPSSASNSFNMMAPESSSAGSIRNVTRKVDPNVLVDNFLSKNIILCQNPNELID